MSSRFFSIFLFLLLQAAPARAAVITPSERIEISWTEEEQSQGIAKRVLFDDAVSRQVVIRLARSEEPHTHAEDLTVWLIKGNAVLHLGNESYPMTAGDTALIPANMDHWAEVEEPAVCEVYAVFHKRAQESLSMLTKVSGT